MVMTNKEKLKECSKHKHCDETCTSEFCSFDKLYRYNQAHFVFSFLTDKELISKTLFENNIKIEITYHNYFKFN